MLYTVRNENLGMVHTPTRNSLVVNIEYQLWAYPDAIRILTYEHHDAWMAHRRLPPITTNSGWYCHIKK